jgi:hypothetical protein
MHCWNAAAWGNESLSWCALVVVWHSADALIAFKWIWFHQVAFLIANLELLRLAKRFPSIRVPRAVAPIIVVGVCTILLCFALNAIAGKFIPIIIGSTGYSLRNRMIALTRE